jgi:hypothetical protein
MLGAAGLALSGLETGGAPFGAGGCLGVNLGIRSGPLGGPSDTSTYGRDSAGSSSSGAMAAAFADRERWISAMNPHIPDVSAAHADVSSGARASGEIAYKPAHFPYRV